MKSDLAAAHMREIEAQTAKFQEAFSALEGSFQEQTEASKQSIKRLEAELQEAHQANLDHSVGELFALQEEMDTLKSDLARATEDAALSRDKLVKAVNMGKAIEAERDALQQAADALRTEAADAATAAEETASTLREQVRDAQEAAVQAETQKNAEVERLSAELKAVTSARERTPSRERTPTTARERTVTPQSVRQRPHPDVTPMADLDLEAGVGTTSSDEEGWRGWREHAFLCSLSNRLGPVFDLADKFSESVGRTGRSRPAVRMAVLLYWVVLHLWLFYALSPLHAHAVAHAAPASG